MTDNRENLPLKGVYVLQVQISAIIEQEFIKRVVAVQRHKGQYKMNIL